MQARTLHQSHGWSGAGAFATVCACGIAVREASAEPFTVFTPEQAELEDVECQRNLPTVSPVCRFGPIVYFYFVEEIDVTKSTILNM